MTFSQTLCGPTDMLGITRAKVGFPIRKFLDQSLFAAPQDLSQRTTSFIASQHQGIHRIPLRHLIALIIDAHPSAEVLAAPHPRGMKGKPFEHRSKRPFCFKCTRPDHQAVKADGLPQTVQRASAGSPERALWISSSKPNRHAPDQDRMHSLFTMSKQPANSTRPESPASREAHMSSNTG
jgi:hypothetical protein